MTSYIIVDCENSGIFDYTLPADAPGQPRLADLGLILVDKNLEIEQEQSFLIKPNGWVFDNNSEAAKVNGLTHERLMEEGVPAAEALISYIAAIDGGRVVGGFNVLFDLKQLRAEMRHVGLEDRYLKTRYICAMQGCRQIVDARTAAGKKKAPRLEEACIHFGFETEGLHTGIGGARRALWILRKLRDLGRMPAWTSPYDKGKKPKEKAAPPDMDQYEFVRSEADFIRGASEDGK